MGVYPSFKRIHVCVCAMSHSKLSNRNGDIGGIFPTRKMKILNFWDDWCGVLSTSHDNSVWIVQYVQAEYISCYGSPSINHRHTCRFHRLVSPCAQPPAASRYVTNFPFGEAKRLLLFPWHHRNFKGLQIVYSMDWFKGKSTGNHGFPHEI